MTKLREPYREGSRHPARMARGLTWAWLAIAAAICCAAHAQDAAPCNPATARVVSLQGKAEILRASAGDWRSGTASDVLCAGDSIRVKLRSRAALYIEGQSAPIRLNENSTLTIPAQAAERSFVMDVAKGKVHVLTRTPGSFTVKTPFVTAAVKGTEFLVDVGDDSAQVTVFEGEVVAANDLGSVDLVKNESAIAERGAAPRKVIIVKPRDAVQWAIYYPPVIDPGAAEVIDANLAAASRLYRDGKVDEALAALEQVPAASHDERFAAFRAGLLLYTGQVEEANRSIESILAANPNNGDALSLQTIISVAHNDKDKALASARRASELAPNSAAAHIALSYAQQAGFQLEAALASAEKAASLEDKNAIAWARVSELQLSMGDLDKALRAANKAAELNPNLGRTQTILGFANLTRIDTKAAKAAFEKSIALDSTDPLPRLGFGLAKIREGDLAEGRTELEIAASLDPENSLVRSYLGKAYYEEKRDQLAAEQFELAKERDPKDPTPWFYDAIRKQTENRPAEALDDLSQSVTLNKNRAVYRSNLLLDQDIAARSASLARIYQELGFDRIGFLKASESISADPSNHSAHRFLADSYMGQPRHEIARLSNLLQAQLRAPISLTPLQPQLATDRLFILDAAGPAGFSQNEYNPLFNRSSHTLLADGLIGGNRTRGDQIVFAGVQDRVSYSLGQFHYETDGFRANNDLRTNVYNAFLHLQATERLNFQAAYRDSNTRQGDLPLRFDPQNFSDLREDFTTKSLRVGARYALGSSADVLGHAEQSEVTDSSVFPGSSFSLHQREKASVAEVQHLLTRSSWNLTSGVGYYRNKRSLQLSILGDLPETEGSHVNVYSYIHFAPLGEWLRLDAGLSYDRVNYNDVRVSKSHPRLGLAWKPAAHTTLRAAGFRTVKRAFVSSQTLEPTEVAGFNYFFDDFDATRTRGLGLAADQELSANLFAGLEFTGRTLDLPPVVGAPSPIDRTWKERRTLAYFYWLISHSFALSAEYHYDKYNRLPEDTGNERFITLEFLLLLACSSTIGGLHDW